MVLFIYSFKYKLLFKSIEIHENISFTSRLFVIAKVDLYYFNGAVASFYDINSVKISLLYSTPRKK